MNYSNLLRYAVLSLCLFNELQLAVAQNPPPTIGQTTLKGFGGASFQTREGGEADQTVRENKVTLRKSTDMVSVSLVSVKLQDFLPHDHSVSKGEFFGGAKVMDDVTVDVSASRKNTKENVRWLTDKGFSLDLGDPTALNFAVIGDLKLSVQQLSGSYSGELTCKGIVLAQGHNSSGNDWWLHSNDLDAPPINFYHENLLTQFDCEGDDNKMHAVRVLAAEKDEFDFVEIR
jgi:hypothetical protein